MQHLTKSVDHVESQAAGAFFYWVFCCGFSEWAVTVCASCDKQQYGL